MSQTLLEEIPVEPERYELHADPTSAFEITRREFFRTFGAGLLVVMFMKDAQAQGAGGQGESGRPGSRGGQSGKPGGQRGPNDAPQEVGGWLHIGEDGAVTAFTGKVEVGQNVRTSLSQAVAEELRVPMSSVTLLMADTDHVPFDRGTFGSRTTPDMSPQLRKAAAAAREWLLDRAAQEWKADRKSLVAAEGKIAQSEPKRSLGYGDLVKGQTLMAVAMDEPPLTPTLDWKVMGQSVPKVGAAETVTGKHHYTSDMKRPGMLHGKVLRPPAFNATLSSVQTDKAEALPGVTVAREGNFVGVAAPDVSQAAKAVAALAAEWKTTPQISRPELFEYLKMNVEPGDGSPTVYSVGSLEEGRAAGDHKLEQTYTVNYIAHTPLEPRAALAEWNDGKLTVWTGTQRPFGVREELAAAFKIPESRIRVIVPDTGSGYGGKHTGEAAVEAARLAKAAGKPVKLVWSREEELTWAYFRPAGVIDVKSAVKDDGTVTAWEFANYNSGPSGIQSKYAFPNQKIDFYATQYPLRQGSYRGLAATANHFAREVHMDELARLVKMDPLEFRLKNTQDDRLKAVLHAAIDPFTDARGKKEKDQGMGIACGFEKGGYVANLVTVAVDRATGKVTIVGCSSAFECGAVVNPMQLKNLVEGALIMGIGGALIESIDFADGKILNNRMARYPVPRFHDVPVIESVLVDRKDLPPAGAGETPIVGIAPAICNAIFDAVGVRLLSMPMTAEALKSEL